MSLSKNGAVKFCSVVNNSAVDCRILLNFDDGYDNGSAEVA